MKQIYDFELNSPPVLNKNMLLAELDRRRLRWQTALIALAGILLQAVTVLAVVITRKGDISYE